MANATLTAKSQLTLPKPVREALGVGPGDTVRFVPGVRGFRIVAVKGGIRAVRGMFKGRRGQPMSIEEINQATSEMGSRLESL